MLRLLLALGGFVLVVAPDRIRSAYERHLIADPDEPTARSWVRPYIRAEGVAAIMVAAIGGRLYRVALWVVGAASVVALAVPRTYLTVAGELAYEDGTELQWREGTATAVRVLGGVLVAVGVFRRHGNPAD